MEHHGTEWNALLGYAERQVVAGSARGTIGNARSGPAADTQIRSVPKAFN